MKRILLISILFLSISNSIYSQTITLIAKGSDWKYLDNGTDQGNFWKDISYNDASWAIGNAQLGYGDGDEATIVSYGTNTTKKYITTYFRKSFSVTNPSSYASLTLALLRDDGAVVYLNGNEVVRSNMPTGTIGYLTKASVGINGNSESAFFTYSIPSSALVAGNNVLAVEIHQIGIANDDISFNLKLSTTPLNTCGTPAGLGTSLITTSSATLNWSAISGATSYTVRYRQVGTTVWKYKTTSLNFLGLTLLNTATPYEFQVQAVCNVKSVYSQSANFTTLPVFTCDTPTGLNTSSITSTEATLNWSAVNGATNYNIQYKPISSATWIPINSTLNSISIVNLLSNTDYEFQVQAICAVNGVYSTSSNFTTLPIVTCDTPTGLIATLITNTDAQLNWSAVNGATNYNIQYKPISSATWIPINSTLNSISIVNLLSNTDYEFQVQAICAVNGVFSTSSNFTTLPIVTCDTPTGLNATLITTTDAQLNWSAVSGASNYNIRYKPISSVTWIPLNSTVNSISIINLLSNTDYEFQVQAICAINGEFSTSSYFTTLPIVTCDTPTGLNVTFITSTSARINWSAVNGSTNYLIQYRKSGTATWTTFSTIELNLLLAGLSSLTTYEFQVQAICSIPGSFSSAVSFTTLNAASGTDSLIKINNLWKYLDDGSNQGTSWRINSFIDDLWKNGYAELGYGDGDETTVVSYGSSSSQKYTTTYFRKSFTILNTGIYNTLLLDLVRDDGAVVYLNGIEVARSNMPAGNITNTTFASAAISSAGESAINTITLSPSSLISGTNILAIEIHQSDLTSSDISFKARLYAATVVIPPVLPIITRGAYLQKLTPTGITIRWRTDIASTSKVQYGTTQSYGLTVTDNSLTTEHIVTISGLNPGTKYFYSIGSNTDVLQGDVKNNFYTAPLSGTVVPVRIWTIGDFGNGSTQQSAVRDAYLNYTSSTPTNLWLWLGDNAYNTGTDAEFQSYVFNVYKDQFKSFPVFPSVGNHDYGSAAYQSTSALGTSFPYFSIFSVPQAGEAGGVASGSPKYYSYDYSNIHFVVLDSYGALNNPGSPMYTWLNNDLAANNQRWTIVYFHHPPYTLGTHNSNTDNELINMRTNIVPLIESYHVDLVLAGHSHINERSYLIKGHFGQASSFVNSMKVSTATTNFTKTAPFDGTIYAVCGTSGQSPSTSQTGYPMPCMYFNNKTNNCSAVIDVNGDNLSLKYLASTGAIVDQFNIVKVGSREGLNLPNRNTLPQITNEGDAKQLTYALFENAKVKVELLNMLGEIVYNFADIPFYQTPGEYTFDLFTGKTTIADGVYFIRININDLIFVEKVFIN